MVNNGSPIGKLSGNRQKKAVKPLLDWLYAARAELMKRKAQNHRMIEMVMHREPWSGPIHDLMLQHLGKREYKHAQHWVFSSYMIAHEWRSLEQTAFKEPELDLKIAEFKWYAYSFKKLTLVDPEAPQTVTKFKTRVLSAAINWGYKAIFSTMTNKSLQAHDRFLALSFLNHLLDLDERLDTNAFERTLEFFKYLGAASYCSLFLNKLWKDPLKNYIDYDRYRMGMVYSKDGSNSDDYNDKKIMDSINSFLRLMDYPQITVRKPLKLFGPIDR